MPICANCAKAGDLGREGDLKRAEKLHRRCLTPSCPCQHRRPTDLHVEPAHVGDSVEG